MGTGVLRTDCKPLGIASTIQGFQGGSKGSFPWISQAIRLCWEFGIDLLKIRNQLVHGTGSSVSQVEVVQVKQLTKSVYKEFKPRLKYNERVVLDCTGTEVDILQFTGNKNINIDVTFINTALY